MRANSLQAGMSQSASSALFGDYFRVWKTVCSMLRKRGYDLSSEKTDLTKEEFDRMVLHNGIINKTKLELDVVMKSDPEHRIMVKWADGAKVGVLPIRTFFEELSLKKVRRGMLIAEGAVSPFAKQAIASFRASGITMEYFSHAELKFDITEHRMVPHHRVLTSVEKTELLERLGVRETQLPRMKTTDPVAKYYGLDRGTVVEITRDSDVSGTYLTYRICVPP